MSSAIQNSNLQSVRTVQRTHAAAVMFYCIWCLQPPAPGWWHLTCWRSLSPLYANFNRKLLEIVTCSSSPGSSGDCCQLCGAGQHNENEDNPANCCQTIISEVVPSFHFFVEEIVSRLWQILFYFYDCVAHANLVLGPGTGCARENNKRQRLTSCKSSAIITSFYNCVSSRGQPPLSDLMTITPLSPDTNWAI